MGIFSKFSKFESKKPINKDGSLMLGKYSAGGYALLKKGKVVEDNIRAISRNVFARQENDNSKVFYVRTRDGDYKIYNIDDGRVIFDSLKPRKDEVVTITQEGESIIVNFGKSKWLINTQGLSISEDYLSIGEETSLATRMVERLNGGLVSLYYVDMRAQKISPYFSIEKDAGEGYKILRVQDGETFKDVIWSKDGKVLSSKYEKIDYINGRFLVSDAGVNYFVNQFGERQTKDIASFQILNNGVLIVREKNSASYLVYDKCYGTIVNLRKPIIDAGAGIIVGERVDGKTVMMGYDTTKIYQVDEPVARLIVSKMMGKSLNGIQVLKIIEKGIDIRQTVGVYEKIILDNLKLDSNNKELKWLRENAKQSFVFALSSACKRKLKDVKIEEEVDTEKLDIFFGKAKGSNLDEILNLSDGEESENEQ